MSVKIATTSGNSISIESRDGDAIRTLVFNKNDIQVRHFVNRATGEKIVSLMHNGDVLISVSSDSGSLFAGNSIFGETDPDQIESLATATIGISGSSGATPAEIETAIENAANIDGIETLLQMVRDRLVQGAGVEAQAQRFTLATDGIGATRLTEIKDRLILGGPALNLGAVNAQTQRFVDASASFATTFVGNYDGTFAASGTSALAAQNIQQLDLQGLGRSEFSLSITCTGSVAAVGAGRTMTFYYAFSPDSGITNPTEFARFIVLPEIPLTNALNAVNRLTSARFLPEARYLYVWHDRTAFNSTAVITPRVRGNLL